MNRSSRVDTNRLQSKRNKELNKYKKIVPSVSDNNHHIYYCIEIHTMIDSLLNCLDWEQHFTDNLGSLPNIPPHTKKI